MAFLTTISMVGAAACAGPASHEAFSSSPPIVREAGVSPPAAWPDASDTAASIDARVDVPTSIPPAHDAGAPPSIAPPPIHDAAVSPPAAARDARVDAHHLDAATLDAAPKRPPVDVVAPGADTGRGADGGSPTAVATSHVFVIAMENESADFIYGSAAAPYINKTLLPASASASAFMDELPNLPSEPHYIWMEAGTNVFPDHTFTTDDSPSAANSTASTQHLTAQIRAAGRGLDWMSYQEGIGAGTCPVTGAGTYVPRHDPMLFFQDVTGDPPSPGNAFCASHHRSLSRLAGDVASGAVASYVFITPNLCHDMHGSPSCPTGDNIRAGDDWLSSALPPLISYVHMHGGVIFITWDEDSRMPFIAVGPHVKAGYRSNVPFQHGSILKTVEEIFHLPILPTVERVSDLSDLFAGGAMP